MQLIIDADGAFLPFRSRSHAFLQAWTAGAGPFRAPETLTCKVPPAFVFLEGLDEYDLRLEQLRQEFRNRPPMDRIYALLDSHLRWAEATKSSNPELAVRQYLLAEEQQSTLGTFATGTGEGLVSRSDLYGIMEKRAGLLEQVAAATTDGDVSRRFVREALSVWSEIDADPNGLGDDTRAASEIRRRNSRLGKQERETSRRHPAPDGKPRGFARVQETGPTELLPIPWVWGKCFWWIVGRRDTLGG